jgi:hypothetical protein
MESESEVVKALKAGESTGQSAEAEVNATGAEETTATVTPPAPPSGTASEEDAEQDSKNPNVEPKKEWHDRKREKKTPEQKSNDAWARLRKKAKAQEDEIARLKELLGQQGNPKDGETEDERLERLGARGYNKARLEELEKERKASQNDLFTALVAEQFPDGKAQAAFKESWEIGERNGTHLKINRDKVIAGFLAKSKLAPRLVHHFALKPEALERIAEIDDDDRKKFELFSLEQRMAAYLADKARAKQSPKKREEAGQEQPTARQILGQQVKSSVIGRQTAPGSANPNKGLSDKDIENIVNRNRFGGLGFRG